ncbi:MAG: hypothetical protein WD595_03765 [Waddliaceae bacterium]
MNYLQEGEIFAVPVVHNNMEFAACVKLAFDEIRPDCVAVELPKSFQDVCLHAASRLPDISVIVSDETYLLCEPCDASFEALRSSLEMNVPAYCIDLYDPAYPDQNDRLPDPYAITRVGLESYWKLVKEHIPMPGQSDTHREQIMAKRLKELSLRHGRVLFVGGIVHVSRLLSLIKNSQFPHIQEKEPKNLYIATLTEESAKDGMGEPGYFSLNYEKWREHPISEIPDRQKLLMKLYKKASESYIQETKLSFPNYHLGNLMKFARNYSLISNRLMPNIFQLLTVAKACVDHNYAFEVWKLLTHYPHLKNIDNLDELDLSPEQLWGDSKMIQFHLKEQRTKGLSYHTRSKERPKHFRHSSGMFSLCSYPPEDLVIEEFGKFLQKKGQKIILDEFCRTQPFSASLEDGIDTKETIRHWHEKKLYVKVHGKPPGAVGSIIVIFDEDIEEKFPLRLTWHGEHDQESDMAFYSTPIGKEVIGPGICRCQYGGFLLSYPPRRLYDIWNDPDYRGLRSKAEVLLLAGIQYSQKSLIVYVAKEPPRRLLKSLASRHGKKVLYIPIGQLSVVILQRMRQFHILDGRDRRNFADEYIF